MMGRGKMGIRDGSFSHFLKARSGKLGIRDGSFSHFSKNEKWEKEPSLIPSFLSFRKTKVGKGTVPDSHFPQRRHKK